VIEIGKIPEIDFDHDFDFDCCRPTLASRLLPCWIYDIFKEIMFAL